MDTDMMKLKPWPVSEAAAMPSQACATQNSPRCLLAGPAHTPQCHSPQRELGTHWSANNPEGIWSSSTQPRLTRVTPGVLAHQC